MKKSTYKIVFSVWFEIIFVKPDSVQNGVGLLRLSIRLVELQSKLFLSIEMTITTIAIDAIHMYIYIMVTSSLQANVIPIKAQSITSNNIRTEGNLSLHNN